MRHLLRIQQGLSSYKTQAQESLFPHFLTFHSTNVIHALRASMFVQPPSFSEPFAEYQRKLGDLIRCQNSQPTAEYFSDERRKRSQLSIFQKSATFDSPPKFVPFCLSLCLPFSSLFSFLYNLYQNCICSYTSTEGEQLEICFGGKNSYLVK